MDPVNGNMDGDMDVMLIQPLLILRKLATFQALVYY